MKRIGGLSILILIISVLLPYHSAADAAERKPVNGVYQVELSFQSNGAADQEVLFDNKAKLTVKEDRYSLSVPVKYQDVIKKITVKQSGSQIKSTLNADENLVQFDMKNIQEKFILEGTFQWSADDIPVSFSQQVVITADSLSETAVEQHNGRQGVIDFVLLTDGKNEPSKMNDYVNPVIKVIKQDGKYYAQMEIIESAWVRAVKVEQQGKMIEPKVIGTKDNRRIVQFEVRDFQKPLRVWVDIKIPERAYADKYFVQLVFDKKQAQQFAENTVSPVPVKPNGSKTPLVDKTEKRSYTPRPSRHSKEAAEAREKQQAAEAARKAAAKEEQLVFDRTQDEPGTEQAVKDQTPVTPAVVQVAGEEAEVKLAPDKTAEGPVIPFDVAKVGVLFLACILSGVLLIRRMINRKKEIVNE